MGVLAAALAVAPGRLRRPAVPAGTPGRPAPAAVRQGRSPVQLDGSLDRTGSWDGTDDRGVTHAVWARTSLRAGRTAACHPDRSPGRAGRRRSRRLRLRQRGRRRDLSRRRELRCRRELSSPTRTPLPARSQLPTRTQPAPMSLPVRPPLPASRSPRAPATRPPRTFPSPLTRFPTRWSTCHRYCSPFRPRPQRM